MNLSLAMAAYVSVGFGFPVWIAWGISFAAVLTIGFFLAGMVMSVGSDGRIGFECDDSVFRMFATFFMVYGLVPGLLGSLLAYYVSMFWGVILTFALLVAISGGHIWLDSWVTKKRNSVAPQYGLPPRR